MTFRPFVNALVAALVYAVAVAFALSTQCQDPGITRLAEQNNLAALVDLCSKRLRLSIEYNPDDLRKTTFLIRLGESVTDEELWTLTNRLLASHGFASIEMPGESVISIVKMTDAPRNSRFTTSLDEESRAGFTTLIVRIQYLAVAEVLNIIKPLQSSTGGTVAQIGTTDLILISDLRPRLEAILSLLENLDTGDPESIPTLERIPIELADAGQIVAEVSAAVTARNAVAKRPLTGKISAALSGDAVILVAPRSSLNEWRSMIEQFDRREPIETRTYQPKNFTNDEVATLIEQTARIERGGSGDRWKVVKDELTRSLIITATLREHERILSILAKLDELPFDRARPLRRFVIRNRNVNELLDVLNRMMQESDFISGTPPEVQDDPSNPNATSGPDTNGTTRTESTDRSSPAWQPASRASRGVLSGSSAVSLTTDELTNTLIAIGDSRSLDQLSRLIEQLDVRQPQVQIDLIVVALNNDQTTNLGIELRKLEVSGNALIGLSSLFGLSNLGIEAETPFIGGRGGTSVILSPGDFSVVIRALKTISEGSSRSNPSVLVRNNQTATLDSVLQQPLLAINTGVSTSTTSFGGNESAGTQITVTPTITQGDHLELEYSVSLSAFVGESADPSLPPPRQQTQVQSFVTIPDGYTIALGGLEVVTDSKSETGIPLLSDLPGVGELFKSRSRSNTRSRFYVFIRANILRHDGFEDLKYLSDESSFAAGVDDGFPELKPLLIK